MSSKASQPAALADETGKVVVERCELADGMWSRMRGLLGRKSLDQGAGLLIVPTNSIHTFFMAFPIDAVFLDKTLRVRSIVPEVKPWRMSLRRGSHSVLELAAGEAERAGIKEGSRLEWRYQEA